MSPSARSWLMRAASTISSPPPRIVLGVWAIVALAVGAAMQYRTNLEQVNGYGFIVGGMALTLAVPQRNMLFAFAGFGLVVSAAAARAILGFYAADSWHGTIIIFGAWGIIATDALQRWAAATVVLLLQQDGTIDER